MIDLHSQLKTRRNFKNILWRYCVKVRFYRPSIFKRKLGRLSVWQYAPVFILAMYLYKSAFPSLITKEQVILNLMKKQIVKITI